MKIKATKQQIEELLTRGVNEVIDIDHLRKRLSSGEKLRIKLGIDPTSPNIHIGRAVVLLKLRDFQDLGHQIIFIIGDFTGEIGDTSDKQSERPMLSSEEIKKNIKTYIKQVGKILDIKKTEVYFNSKWLKKMGYTEIGRQANQFSLAEFISRENIRKRLKLGKRISLRELLYPLMQGYDSVVIKADLEVGGTDQRFNLLSGRALQAYYKQQPQDILMMNLIPGKDGRKMSSSWGNTINIFDKPNDMFGKLMSIPDELIISYFEHCTRIPIKQIKQYAKRLKANTVNPREIKIELAKEITTIYWGKINAQKAEENFNLVFQKKEIPDKIPEQKLANKNIVDVLFIANLAQSKSEARRLIEQKGIKINGKTINSIDRIIKRGDVIQKGKRYFLKII
ncbi:tyrosine--tRNA ligase [Candidatus Parcubacteria bacterium 4484_255]|nr:MAG: tyrosine--tRNA ligase [Candidatus Parcubacteria bacterium 4484_255]